jgi:hypothetical protein
MPRLGLPQGQETEMTTFANAAAALDTLRANLAALPANDQGFAQSLIDQSAARGLSEKQMLWVNKLALRATGTAPAPQAVTVGDFAGVIALFATARAHLKHPRIRLQTEAGQKVALAVAGENARRPGTVNVTDGRPFGEGTWFGRVTPEGAWEVSSKVDAATATSVSALLTALASNPAGTAAHYGRLTGNCCFCNRTLTDERSTDVGYGPICADRFGLPWGAR